MFIEVSVELVRRMYELAKREDDYLAEQLGNLLKRYAEEAPKYATLADLARYVDKLHAESLHEPAALVDKLRAESPDEPAALVDTAERSREILNTEFPDYLASRVDP